MAEAQAQPKMEEVGVVEGFFAHPSAAIIKLKGKLKKGERIYIKGHTTDLQLVVQSMQMDHKDIAEGKQGDVIGIQVGDRVRQHDVVYRVG